MENKTLESGQKSSEVYEYTYDIIEKLKEIDAKYHLIEYLEQNYPWIPNYYSKLKFQAGGIVVDWIRNDQIGGFQYYKPDDEYEDIINNLIPKMIKRIAVEIIKGVNFFNVTMPVEIFDTKSFLEIIGQ